MTLLIQFHRHLLLHFNSHPHEEDDNRTGDCYNLGSISTHILTRRMTKTFHIIAYDRYISTHILTRRMTPLTKYVGAPDVFQLTSSRGGWLTETSRFLKLKSFQLTSSRGGWRLWLLTVYLLRHFNSHPHEEDDLCNARNPEQRSISTHILTRRMTKTISSSFVYSLFQLTSSRGGWRDTAALPA